MLGWHSVRRLFANDIDQFNRHWQTQITSAAQLEHHAQALLASLSLDEKIAQLSGPQGINALAAIIKLGIYVMGLKRFPNMYAGRNTAKNIPAISFSDGPRGVVIGRATCFPVASLRGASFDPQLELAIGEAIGREVRASNANYFAGLCVNLLRHPAWGRAQETYGEDPQHLALMGTALMHGVQAANCMVCAKHFAVNSIENSRFYLDVHIDDSTLHEVYLPHFKALVDAGIDSLMSAYNQVNGEYAGHSEPLLDTILRKQWGFDGFVSSDWLWGIYQTIKPAKAGMDLEMPIARFYGNKLKCAVERGTLGEKTIDQMCLRILRKKLNWAMTAETKPAKKIINSKHHRQLALRSALESIVLLKNDGALPLSAAADVLVVGNLLKEKNIGDNGSSRVSPRSVAQLTAAIKKHFPAARFLASSDPELVTQEAAQAQSVIVIAGFLPEQEGENLISNRSYKPDATEPVNQGGDRKDLHLPPDQQALLSAVTLANPNTSAVIISGSACYLDPWLADLRAVLWAGYYGECGADALAQLLAGKHNPAGHLPFSWPAVNNTLPPFDRTAPNINYAYFHGYRLLDQLNEQPAFYFGHGLSYSQLTISAVELIAAPKTTADLDAPICVSATVSNVSEMAAKLAVQCYSQQMQTASPYLPQKVLQTFQKVYIAGHSSTRLQLSFPLKQLARFINGEWQIEAGEYNLHIGSSSDPKQLTTISLRLTADIAEAALS